MPAVTDAASSTFGGYRLLDLLGEGGMGAVWRAERIEDGGRVALKLMKRSDDADAHRRLAREGRAAMAIRHPNVVRVDEVLEVDGAPALVMELLEGESLAKRVEREGVLSIATFARIAIGVCDALEAAHAHGIIHRDLKPENVFLAGAPGADDDELVVKVLDFGIAKLTSLDAEARRTTGLTATGAVLGTPSYMSPEQIFGERDVDARADIWALGIVAYECLSGVLPTVGSNVGQILKNILGHAVWPLGETSPDLPSDVTSLVDRMLERDRSKRVASLGEVREVFRAHLASTAQPLRATVRSRDDEPASFDEAPRRASSDAATLAAPSARRAVATAAPTMADLVLAVRRPKPRATKAFGALAAALFVVVGGGVYAALHVDGGLAVRPAAASTSARAPAPALAPSDVLACPVLEASGVDAPTSWLGAAAADVACRRATWMLGGSPERTRTPADLLDAPRRPTGAAASDPFDDDARARSLEAARTRARVILDGRVARAGAAFEIDLRLERTNGELLGAAHARGRLLAEATQRALDTLASSGALPLARELDPAPREALFLPDPAAGLASEDLSANVRDAKPLCDVFLRRDATRPWWPFLGDRCERGETRAEPTLDRATPFTLAFSAMAVRDRHPEADVAGATDDLARARKGAASATARGVLAYAEAFLAFTSHDATRARDALLASLADDPRSPETWSLLTRVQTSAGEAPSAREAAAWSPGLAVSWDRFLRASGDEASKARFGARAYVLADRPRVVATDVGTHLAAAGKLEEVRSMIADLVDGDPEGAAAADFLKGLLDLSMDKPAAAYARFAASALGAETLDDGPVWTATSYALPLGALLAGPSTFADAWARRFVLGDRLRVDLGDHAIVPFAIRLCARASRSVARKCLARIEASKPSIRFWSGELDALLDGAKAWAKGDARAAVRAWRPLLASGKHALSAEAFDAANEPELAKRCDAILLEKERLFHGVSMVAPWAALRAERRGDVARARELASAVVAAWSVTDAPIPAVDTMRALLARTKEGATPAR